MPVTVTAEYAADPAASTDAHAELVIEISNGTDAAIEQVQVEPQKPFGKPYAAPAWVDPVDELAAGESVEVRQFVSVAGDAPAVPDVKIAYVSGGRARSARTA